MRKAPQLPVLPEGNYVLSRDVPNPARDRRFSHDHWMSTEVFRKGLRYNVTHWRCRAFDDHAEGPGGWVEVKVSPVDDHSSGIDSQTPIAQAVMAALVPSTDPVDVLDARMRADCTEAGGRTGRFSQWAREVLEELIRSGRVPADLVLETARRLNVENHERYEREVAEREAARSPKVA